MPDPKTIRHLGLDIGTTNTSLCYTSYTPSEGQFNVPTPTRFGDDDFLHSAILLDDYDRPIAFGDEALRHPVYQAHPERLREEFKLGLGDDPSAEQPDGPSAAGSLLRVLTALPKRSDNLVAVVNGLFGDALDDRDSHWATPMTIRAGDTVLPLDRDALRDSLSAVDVGPRLCVLVHGLMSTESIWRFPGDRSTTFGTSAERTIWKPLSEMSQPMVRSESG